MTYISEIFEISKAIYLELNKVEDRIAINGNYYKEQHNQFKYLIESIENRLLYLLPESKNQRFKRGLINGLGSIVKSNYR